MLGRIIQDAPAATRWGDGRDGDVTWSNDITGGGRGNWYNNAWLSKRTHKNGFFQFDKLTIESGTHVEVTSQSLSVPRRLIIFCRKELVVGSNVLINAGANNFYRQSDDYRAFGSNYTDGGNGLNVGTGGGGGGGGGADRGHTGEDGYTGQDPRMHYTLNRGSSRGAGYLDPGDASGGEAGAGRRNRFGENGGSGWPRNVSDEQEIKNQIARIFGFTTRAVTGRLGAGVDDFPLWIGGRGGNGGRGGDYGSAFVNGGHGGRGGGSVIIVAPKVTFGSNFIISIAGNTRNNGHPGADPKDGNNNDRAHKGMNGRGNGDGGSAGGGAGGGGFCGIVYGHNDGKLGSGAITIQRNGTTPANLGTLGDYIRGDSHAYGGYGKTGRGNRGGGGGYGGEGIYMVGRKGMNHGPIYWHNSGDWGNNGAYKGIDGNA